VAALRIATVENQFCDPFRMGCGIVDGDGCALRDAQNGKPICFDRFDNGFKIAREIIEGKFRHVAIRQTSATGIVAD
jgi:hypothetical protein